VLSTLPFDTPDQVIAQASGGAAAVTAVAGAGSRVAMESARRAAAQGLIEPVLVGDLDVVAAIARDMDWDMDGIRRVAALDERRAAEVAVALARGGEAAALMKGQVHTDVLMRAVVDRDNGLRTGRRMSHVFYMTAAGRDGSIAISDAAINVAPDPGMKLDIVNNAVGMLHAMGIAEPKVAVLSATETPIAAMPSSLDAAEVVRRAAEGEVSNAVVDGPFALDIAVSPEAAAIKGVDSPVAGRADLLIMPNIEAGNAVFKAMVYFMSATAAGLVMGAKVPIILTSRADPPEARLTAAALAAIVARHDPD
jgi:phosphate acetyltransferase